MAEEGNDFRGLEFKSVQESVLVWVDIVRDSGFLETTSGCVLFTADAKVDPGLIRCCSAMSRASRKEIRSLILIAIISFSNRYAGQDLLLAGCGPPQFAQHGSRVQTQEG